MTLHSSPCASTFLPSYSHVEWSHDGQFIAVAHSTNRVVVHPRPGSSSEAVTLPAPRSPVTALAFQVRGVQLEDIVCVIDGAWERKSAEVFLWHLVFFRSLAPFQRARSVAR